MSSRTFLRVAATVAVVAAVALAATGCTAEEAAAPTSLLTPIPSMAQPIPSGDGTLLIGVVVPLSGADSAIGAPSLAGAELAARDIQQAGGVNGGPVRLVHADSGDAGAATAAASVSELDARGVDAFVGSNAQAVLPALAEAAAGTGVALVGATGDPVSAEDAFTERLKTSDPTLTDARYGVESYDAVVMIALAAALAGDDGRTSVAQFLPAVTSGAVECRSYSACLDVLTTRSDIRYTGVTGTLSTAVA
ncbi:ABC transporter substrate-binding protein [Herbiconiux liukaitaii]|uniref:ABC transporter substrate-binding protein n=1 Tax=Herbiconiux liukaitaii TaxID=3342799 RepID=UPI0035B6F31C